MMKQALRSYVASLHPRNIKKLKKEQNGSWFWIVYWLFVYPSLYASNNDSVLEYSVYTMHLIIKMLPLILLGWSNMVGHLSMPKAMYFVPMKKEERREYVRDLKIIKILVPVLFSIGLNIVWGIFYEINILQTILIAFLYITIGIGSHICSSLVNKHDRYIGKAVRDKNGEPKDAWMNIIAAIIAIILLVGLEMNDLRYNLWFEQNSIIGTVFIWSVIMLLLVFDVFILKTRYHAAIEDSCNYEVVFGVVKKSK